VEIFAELLSAIAAVVLTVACGLLCEELLFGGLARLFFVPRPGAGKKPIPGARRERRTHMLALKYILMLVAVLSIAATLIMMGYHLWLVIQFRRQPGTRLEGAPAPLGLEPGRLGAKPGALAAFSRDDRNRMRFAAYRQQH
jgi:hypothetical protein